MRNSLKQLREKRDMSLQELSNFLEISNDTLLSIENSEYVPSVSLALKISKVFNKPVEEIFILGQEKKPNKKFNKIGIYMIIGYMIIGFICNWMIFFDFLNLKYIWSTLANIVWCLFIIYEIPLIYKWRIANNPQGWDERKLRTRLAYGTMFMFCIVFWLFCDAIVDIVSTNVLEMYWSLQLGFVLSFIFAYIGRKKI